MTTEQRSVVNRLLWEWLPDEVHHGDCVGADAEFAEMCAALVPRPRIVAHPGESAKGGENHLRANSPHNDDVLPTKTHFARNRDMVDLLVADSDALVGTPADEEWQPHGGTWYTLDYAIKQGVKVINVSPSGNTVGNRSEG